MNKKSALLLIYRYNPFVYRIVSGTGLNQIGRPLLPSYFWINKQTKTTNNTKISTTMKTLKALTTAVLLVFSVCAFAKDDTKNNKIQMDYAISTYINAVNSGNIKALPTVLDENVKFTRNTSDGIQSYGKSDILSEFKNYENVEQNCETRYEILEQGTSQAIVKVVMKYENFSKVNILTLANTQKGWKITNISASFN